MKVIWLIFKVVLPIVVLALCAVLAMSIVKTREAPNRRPKPVNISQVEVIEAKRSSYDVRVRSQGTVKPRTESTLIPEISGRIVTMAPSLRAGGFFEAGELLLELDPREYEAAATIATADLTQAQAQLSEELARAKQARREWERLGEKGQPDALVLRKPQVASARAAVSSAQARLVQRQLDLERTRIIAPYAGRVLEKNVDVGQYVATGSVMARIYAVDYVEIRLPLSDSQLQYVAVPEIYRSDAKVKQKPGPPVVLYATLGKTRYEWMGRLMRAEGSIDTRTRQLYVIAQVDDPYAQSSRGSYPLKIGQFVEADIQGTRLEEVFVIPRGSLRAGSQVLLVDTKNQLQNQSVDVVWTDETNAVISGGLQAGDRIVTTALGESVSGTPIRVKGQQPATQGKRAGNKRRGSDGKDANQGRRNAANQQGNRS